MHMAHSFPVGQIDSATTHSKFNFVSIEETVDKIYIYIYKNRSG